MLLPTARGLAVDEDCVEEFDRETVEHLGRVERVRVCRWEVNN
jgi:hypothetical protein